jgi:predicted nucleic acid-binding protein
MGSISAPGERRKELWCSGAMTRYLLDTDAVIDLSKRREPAFSRILAWIDQGETVGVCAITVAEFAAGLSVEQLSEWEEFLSSLTYWEISLHAAVRAGQDRYSFARQGKAISITDCLVAACSRELDALVVTGNVKDYPMADVQVSSLLST